MIRLRHVFPILAIASLTAAMASDTWSEVIGGVGVDAGSGTATAQLTTGNGPLLHIVGTLSSFSDVDVFAFTITTPAAFAAATLGNGTVVDTQLFLFDAAGVGISANDDAPQGGRQSVLTSLYTASLPAGAFYLAISAYDRDPVDSGSQLLWQTQPFSTERAPDGPGAAHPIFGWTPGNAQDSGPYKIDLGGSAFGQPDFVAVLPNATNLAPGAVFSGAAADALTSNDAYYTLRPGVVFSNAQDPVALTLDGIAPGSTPTGMSIVVESRASANLIRQVIDAYRFADPPGYILVDSVSPLPFGANPDTVRTITLSEPSTYVGSGNAVRMRLRFRATGALFAYPWKTSIDEATWRYYF